MTIGSSANLAKGIIEIDDELIWIEMKVTIFIDYVILFFTV